MNSEVEDTEDTETEIDTQVVVAVAADDSNGIT